jgi:hypothetical protein
VGRAAALLKARGAAAVVLFAALVTYYEVAPHLWRAGLWWDVAWIAVVLLPAVFALVLLALPLQSARHLLPVGLGAAVLAAILTVAGFDILANFARLAATSLLGWWFLGYFEAVSWVVLVACVIPWVDAYSVWRGPTKKIIKSTPQVFDWLSFGFPLPGSHGLFQLGVPDLLFFALFLGAAARFRLRVVATWLALVVALGATITLTVWWDLSGLPALPGIALGFLVPNADLLLRASRGKPRFGERADVAVGGTPDDG